MHSEEALKLLLTSLSNQIEGLGVEIRDLRKDLNMIRAPQYQTYVTAVGVLLVGSGMLWGVAIRPLEVAQETFAHKDLVQQQSEQTTKDLISLSERLKEFATKDDLNNLIISIDRRLPQKHD